MLKNTLKYFSREENQFREGAKYSFSIWLSVIILFVAGFALKMLVPDVFNPDIAKLFLVPDKMFVPEQSEKAAFYGIVVLMPLVFLLSYLFFSKYGRSFLEKLDAKWVLLSAFASVLLLIFFTFTINDFFYPVFEAIYSTSAAFIIGLGLIYLWQAGGVKTKKYLTYFFLLFCAAVLAQIFSLYLVSFYAQDHHSPYHFEAYYYPVYKVLSGQAMGYRFNSIYGFYPYIYELIFKVIGPVSILKFSAVNAFLVCFGAASAGYFLWRAVKNKTLWFFGFIAYIYATCGVMGELGGGYYLQFQPHRLIFLSLVFALCAVYYKSLKFERVLYYGGFLLCALAVFWNLESGLICLAVWCSFLAYLSFARFGFKEKRSYTHLAELFLQAFLTIIFVLIIFLVLSYIKSGKLFPLQNIFAPYLFFYKYGYMMLKMQWYHPWFLLGLVYLVSLSKSLLALLRGQADIRGAALFILTVAGIAVFPYYQGRSHILVFSAVIFPAVLILTLLADEYWEEFLSFLKSPAPHARFVCRFAAAKFILIFFFMAFTMLNVINMLFVSDSLFKFRDGMEYSLLDKAEEVASLAPQGQSPALMTYDNASYYTMFGWPDDVPLSEEYFTYDDFYRVIEYLSVTDKPVIIEKDLYNSFRVISQELFYGVLLQRWGLGAKSPQFICFIPRQGAAVQNAAPSGPQADLRGR